MSRHINQNICRRDETTKNITIQLSNHPGIRWRPGLRNQYLGVSLDWITGPRKATNFLQNMVKSHCFSADVEKFQHVHEHGHGQILNSSCEGYLQTIEKIISLGVQTKDNQNKSYWNADDCMRSLPRLRRTPGIRKTLDSLPLWLCKYLGPFSFLKDLKRSCKSSAPPIERIQWRFHQAWKSQDSRPSLLWDDVVAELDKDISELEYPSSNGGIDIQTKGNCLVKQSRLSSLSEHSDACVVDTPEQNHCTNWLGAYSAGIIAIDYYLYHKYPMNITHFCSSQSLSTTPGQHQKKRFWPVWPGRGGACQASICRGENVSFSGRVICNECDTLKIFRDL